MQQTMGESEHPDRTVLMHEEWGEGAVLPEPSQ